MLTPDEIANLGWESSNAMSRAEWRMLRAIYRYMKDAIEGGSQVDAAQMASAVYREARTIARESSGDITDAFTKERSEGLRWSMGHDFDALGETLSEAARAALTASLARTGTLAAAGAETYARHAALDMAQDAAAAYLETVSKHVVMVAAGGEPTDVAVARSVKQLADRGLRTIDYARTGIKAQPDVAARRAVRTMVQQAGSENTLSVCKAAGVRLIEVTSHVGARPSHAEWQGRVYADPGPVTIGGTTYPDFGKGTGYYGEGPYGALGDRLCGVNCRHSFAPYLHSEPRMWEHDPDGGKGWDNAEVYQDRQTQRAYERDVRKHKNRADLLDEAGGDEAAKEAAAERAKVRSIQKELRDFVDSKDWLQRDYRLERSTKQNAYIAEHSRGA